MFFKKVKSVFQREGKKCFPRREKKVFCIEKKKVFFQGKGKKCFRSMLKSVLSEGGKMFSRIRIKSALKNRKKCFVREGKVFSRGIKSAL